MESKHIMDIKREALEEFEAYHCLHWALLISTESLVLFFSLLLRVIMWQKNLRYYGGRILSL